MRWRVMDMTSMQVSCVCATWFFILIPCFLIFWCCFVVWRWGFWCCCW
jgi:hypothetical protein